MSAVHGKVAFNLVARLMKPSELKVLMGVCFEADEAGTLEIILEEFGEQIGYGRSFVNETVSSLRDKGLLTREPVRLGQNNRDRTRITLTLAKYQEKQENPVQLELPLGLPHLVTLQPNPDAPAAISDPAC